MNFLDLTLPTPAENLACDEALLEHSEISGAEILRFWEPREVFVVVGYANQVSLETNLAACEKNGIPILRRCTGGGTVLQGQGVLNYSLILKIAAGGPTASVHSANQFIMERNRAAIEKAVSSQQSAVRISVCGHTDLTLDTHHRSLVTSKKFSGNAQRRKKNFLLFHGAFLLDFDLSLVEKFLAMPSSEPGYRHGRSHGDFITNLHLPAGTVKHALLNAWKAGAPLENIPREQIKLLSHEKYVTNRWNFKF